MNREVDLLKGTFFWRSEDAAHAMFDLKSLNNMTNVLLSGLSLAGGCFWRLNVVRRQHQRATQRGRSQAIRIPCVTAMRTF